MLAFFVLLLALYYSFLHVSEICVHFPLARFYILKLDWYQINLSTRVIIVFFHGIFEHLYDS